MRMKKALLGCILLLTISTLAHAQLIQTGRWRTHLSYKNALICEASNRYVYAASQQGFFRVMMNYGDMEKLGKEEGFAYNEVTTLAYNGEKDILLIGSLLLLKKIFLLFVQVGKTLLPEIFLLVMSSKMNCKQAPLKTVLSTWYG